MGRRVSRRSWSPAQKRQIVEEAYRPGASVADVARSQGLNANQAFNWRRRAIAAAPPKVKSASFSAALAPQGEVFGLSISKGAICNILARAQGPLGRAADDIAAHMTTAEVVVCDEIFVRVVGEICWEWAEPAKVPAMRSIDGKQAEGLVTAARVLHLVHPSRGAGVVRALFGDARLPVWISDSLGSQRGHAEQWRMCLAHLLRDAQYAVECGDPGFSAAFGLLLLRAVAIGRRRETLLDTTLRQYRADLDRRLDRIMGLPRHGEAAERLRRRIARDREHLFVFVIDRRVPPTNNVSERALRPSVIFRKVINGFRSQWGANTYAAFRCVVSTAKANGRSVLGDLRDALATQSAERGIAQPGCTINSSEVKPGPARSVMPSPTG